MRTDTLLELPPPGTCFGAGGRFEIIRELGRGGLGVVLLARDRKLGRHCAIKLIQPVAGELRAADYKNFEREARLTAKVDHPGIVTIYDYGTWRDRIPYLVLEYLNGESLADVLVRHGDDRRMSVEQVLDIALQLCAALDHAHQHDVLHLDLKPSNLVLLRDGRLKVLDFGVASLDPFVRAHEDTVTLTEHATDLVRYGYAGSPAYTAPEHFSGTRSPQADVWSLGVILFEMLTGRRPFIGGDLIQIMYAVANAPIPRVTELRTELPAAFADVIDKALSRELDKRYKTARALADDLRQVQQQASSALQGEPYRYLESFRVCDAPWFFGREAETNRLRTHLAFHSLVAVVGPSGAGKTSVVQAGLLASLRGETPPWAVASIRPGQTPLDALAQAINSLVGAGTITANDVFKRPGAAGVALREWASREQHRVLLYVDAFEELFALRSVTRPAETQAFIDALLGIGDDETSALRIVLSLRDDYLVETASLPGLREPLGRGLVLLGRPGHAALAASLSRPAERLGYRLESCLPEAVLEEVEEQAVPLPLLQLSMSLLWEQRDDDRKLIPMKALDAVGGISGILRTHAEAVIARFADEDELKCAREIICSLVTADRTIRQRPRAELLRLVPDGPRADRVLTELIRGRLLLVTTNDGNDQIELVHASLIDGWMRLRRWLDEDGQRIQLRDELCHQARRWSGEERPEWMLWRDGLLSEALGFFGSSLPVAEQFLPACADSADALDVCRLAKEVTRAWQTADSRPAHSEESVFLMASVASAYWSEVVIDRLECAQEYAATVEASLELSAIFVETYGLKSLIRRMLRAALVSEWYDPFLLGAFIASRSELWVSGVVDLLATSDREQKLRVLDCLKPLGASSTVARTAIVGQLLTDDPTVGEKAKQTIVASEEAAVPLLCHMLELKHMRAHVLASAALAEMYPRLSSDHQADVLNSHLSTLSSGETSPLIAQNVVRMAPEGTRVLQTLLARLDTSSENETAVSCARALGRMTIPDAHEALRERLCSQSARVRTAVIHGLWKSAPLLDDALVLILHTYLRDASAAAGKLFRMTCCQALKFAVLGRTAVLVRTATHQAQADTDAGSVLVEERSLESLLVTHLDLVLLDLAEAIQVDDGHNATFARDCVSDLLAKACGSTSPAEVAAKLSGKPFNDLVLKKLHAAVPEPLFQSISEIKPREREQVEPNGFSLVPLLSPSGQAVHPQDRPLSVGRSRACDVRIDGASASRRHAIVGLSHGEMWVEDVDSSAGTFVNGRRVVGRRSLHHYDVVSFGASTFAVTEVWPAGAQAVPISSDTTPHPDGSQSSTSKADYLLRVISGPLAGAEFQLMTSDVLLIGRDEELDVALPENMVSRHHATLSVADDGITIRDAASVNGTFVNGVPISCTKLSVGDRILIGTSCLKLTYGRRTMDSAQSDLTFRGVSLTDAQAEATSYEHCTLSGVLTGQIEQVPLADLLALFLAGKRTGQLVLFAKESTGRIVLRSGDLCSASIEDSSLSTRDALIRLMLWTSGRFVFDNTVEPDSGELSEPMEALLADVERGLDALAQLEHVPDLHALVRVPVPLLPSVSDLTPELQDVLQLALNHGCVETILNNSGGNDMETLQELNYLLQRGYLLVDASGD